MTVNRQVFESMYSDLKSIIEAHHFNYDFADINGNVLLHYAAIMGDTDKVKQCLDVQADINLENLYNIYQKKNTNPLALALANGNLETADYLYQKGAKCDKIDLSVCRTNEAKAWFTQKIKNALLESFPKTPLSAELVVENQFFSKLNDNIELKMIERAVEIGEIQFLKNALSSTNIKATFELHLDSLLIIAAKNGQLDTMKFLIEQGASINTKKMYQTSALMAAIQYKQQEAIDYLLDSQGIDLNQKDSNNQTALVYAINSSNVKTVEKLLSMQADVNSLNCNNNTLLHLAIMNNSKLLGNLLEIPEIKKQIQMKNIYGLTPLDVAINRKNDDAIRLIAPDMDISALEKNPNYGLYSPNIDHGYILSKMRYRLRLLSRNLDLIGVLGHCAGFTYLESFYNARGMKDYYFDTLRLMANWDGTEQALKEPFKDIQQAAFYKNLDDLFEQWTNDAIWFHHNIYKITTFKQEDRLEQYQIIASEEVSQNKSDYEPVFLFREMAAKNRNLNQIKEVISYILRMPNNVNIIFSGAEHATTMLKKNDEPFYYDPNIPKVIKNDFSLDDITDLILKYKYCLLEQYHGDLLDCRIHIFFYKKQLENLNNFEIFSESELPKSKQAEQEFQNASPSHYSHLHIAMMTKSIASVEKIIKSGFYDINSVDAYSETPIDIAVKNNFYQAIQLLMSPNIDDALATKAFQYNNKQILELILTNTKSIQMEKLFQEALSKNDFTLVQRLITEGKVNINLDSLTFTALSKRDISFVDFLLNKGVNLCAINQEDQQTALKKIMMFNINASLVISNLKDINEFDDNGCSALYYAIKCGNLGVMDELLKAGADIHHINDFDENFLDILSEIADAQNPTTKEEVDRSDNSAENSASEIFEFNENSLSNFIITEYNPIEVFPNIKKVQDCFSLLLDHLIQQNNSTRLINLITESVKKNDALFSIILSKCDKTIFEQPKYNNQTLLYYLLIERQFEKMKTLIEKGVNIDQRNATTGNTLLMSLIKVSNKNLPEKYQLISFFLKHNPDLSIKNNDKMTALELVDQSKDKNLKKLFAPYLNEKKQKEEIKSKAEPSRASKQGF